VTFLNWFNNALLDLNGIKNEFTTKIYFKRFFLALSVRSRWDVKDFKTTEAPSIEFIGYRIPQHKQNSYTVLFTRHQSKKVCREILVSKIFFLWRPFTRHVSLTFSYSNLRRGYLDNQSEYPKSLAHFCLLILCEWLCAFFLLVLRYPIPDKFTRANLGRFNSYRLLTLTKNKNCLNYTFIVNFIF